jgi:serine/threonine-protein kinase
MSAESPDRTVTVVTTPSAPALTRSRTAVPVLSESPPDADADLKQLLARRLRQAFAILTVIYAAFLVRHFANVRVLEPANVVQTLMLMCAVSVQGAVAVVAWVRRRRGLGGWLRVAEAITLVTFWGTQGVNQFETLRHTDRWVVSLDAEGGQVLAANLWELQWFAVLVGYPVLVPHPPHRMFAIAAVTASMPVLMTAAASAANPDLTLARTWLMHVTFVLWGLVGGSIAVYGAGQAALLRKEAFEARKFGQYHLVRRLDGGGMGEVFLAEHRLLRRPSVIKLIRPDRRTDPKMFRRFEREVKLLATLTHWNTVEVYDYGHTADGTFYFVMEYLPGVNLSDLVKRHGPLPPGRAVFLLAQVCRGLREAHQVGLIHRDVKPANVMACGRGGLHDVAKLLDFGLVRGPDDPEDAQITREGVILGTPAYLSPEQACGQPLDARSDLYSLGCTLFFLLTGKPPFDLPGAVATASAHIHQPPPHPDGVPADLAAVVRRCLAKKPTDRYASVRELEVALTGCACAPDWDHDKAADWWRANRDG